MSTDGNAPRRGGVKQRPPRRNPRGSERSASRRTRGLAAWATPALPRRGRRAPACAPALALSARHGPRLLPAASETCGVACWLRGDLLWPVGYPGVQPSVIPAVPGRACPREIPLGSLDGVKNAALPGVGTGASPPRGGLKPSTEREAASSEGGTLRGTRSRDPSFPRLRTQAVGRGTAPPGSAAAWF